MNGKPVEVDAVIGADGANGITARSLGLGGAIVNGVALEGNLPVRGAAGRQVARDARARARHDPGRLRLDLSEGGSRERRRRRLGARRARDCATTSAILCEHYGIELEQLSDLRGHRLPMRRPGIVLARGRALVVGDAAGALDPVSGDGIYEALVTARLAAEHTLALLDGAAETLEPYEPAVRRELDPLASAGWGAKLALDRFPTAVFAVMRLPVTWPVLEKLVLGEFAYPGRGPRSRPEGHQVIEALARLARNPRTAPA